MVTKNKIILIVSFIFIALLLAHGTGHCFTYTWDSSFEASPADTDNISEGATKIRQFKSAVQERMEVDHVWDLTSQSGHGEHTKVTFNGPLSADPTNETNKGFLYLKDDANNNKAELHFIDEDGDVMMLTSGGELSYTLIDGDKLDIDFTPSNYTPAAPAEGDDVDDLSAHLNGIDVEIGVIDIILRGYIDGFQMSKDAVTATELDISAGQCSDYSSTTYMTLSSAFAKVLSDTFAEGTGNNGLDTGSVAASTWYHVYLIAKTDSTIDVVFSTGASGPTSMPSGFTYWRRIGSVYADASKDITEFHQDGDRFYWDTPFRDQNLDGGTDGLVTGDNFALRTPLGLETTALIYCTVSPDANVQVFGYVRNPDYADFSPGGTTFYNVYADITSADSEVFAATNYQQIKTNTSSQVFIRTNNENCSFNVYNYGWIDLRGKDS